MRRKHLNREFCRECNERMQRANAALRLYSESMADDCYKRVLQEFDSLYGAARAVHFPEWEEFSHALRKLAADMRGKIPATDARAHALLESAVSLSLSCGGDAAHCLITRQREAGKLMADIRAYLVERRPFML